MFKLLFTVMLMVLFILPQNAEAKSQNVSIDGDHGKLSAILQTPDKLKEFPIVIICHSRCI